MLASKMFNQAAFAIELYNLTWDFGPVTFKNVILVSLPRILLWLVSSKTFHEPSILPRLTRL